MKVTKQRILIYRTEGEFKRIEEHLLSEGSGGLSPYLRKKIYKLERLFNECPNCIVENATGRKIQKSIPIEPETYETLKQISVLLQKPIATIIDDFFIAPLLHPR